MCCPEKITDHKTCNSGGVSSTSALCSDPFVSLMMLLHRLLDLRSLSFLTDYQMATVFLLILYLKSPDKASALITISN